MSLYENPDFDRSRFVKINIWNTLCRLRLLKLKPNRQRKAKDMSKINYSDIFEVSPRANALAD